MIDTYFSPEQVADTLQLAVKTVYRWLRSGKLRGTRISHKAWRISQHDLHSFIHSFMTKRNVSEILFEEYVREHRLGTPDHEPVVPGKSRRVDYRLPFRGQPLWFEVKEFAEDPQSFAEGGGGPFDPHVAIRKKIHKASEKFREYGGECCSLVLYNDTVNLAEICSPEIVLGAMLGNVSFSVPMDGIETGPAHWFFANRGRLLQPGKNTTISAVIALERLTVGHRRFRIEAGEKGASGK